MSTHTPGPWKVAEIQPEDGGIAVRYDGPDHRWHVATVYGQSDQEKPIAGCECGRQSANARLIALAPEMVEALRMFRDLYEPVSAMADDAERSLLDEIHDAARDLLARLDEEVSSAPCQKED